MANNNLLSKLVVRNADKTDFDLVEENSLAVLQNTKPFEMATVISSAISKSNKNIFDVLTDGAGATTNKQAVNNREIKWDVLLATDNSYTVTKSPIEIEGGTSTNVGHSGQSFKIGFAGQHFTRNDKLISEDDRYRLHVMDEGYSDGSHYLYTFKLTGNMTSFPVEEALAGKRFTNIGTYVGEGSDRGGGFQVARPMTLTNCLNTMRLSYKVTRDAATTGMKKVIECEGADGQTFKTWTSYADWMANLEFNRRISFSHLSAVYGQTNEFNVLNDKTGRPIYEGAGLEDQVSGANILYYNGFLTYGKLKEFVTDLSYQVTRNGGDCDFTLIAGWRLYEAVINAVLAEYKNNNPTFMLQNSVQFLTGTAKEFTYTDPQVKDIEFSNGIKLKVIRFNDYNDETFYKKKHLGSTKKSYEGMILNLAPSDGKPNLVKCYKEGSEMISTVVEGMYGPNGPTTKASTGFDGYEIHKITQQGLIVRNPVGSARILLNF